jgi:3-phenylpropionate/trans-cinnamate dioxygenase ferredoxin reductase subunit
MTRLHDVTVNGETFKIRTGDLLLDAALVEGIDLPFECRSGRCGSCTVRLLEGHLLGGETGDPGMVRACQSRVFSDVSIAVERRPDVRSVRGTLTKLRWLGEDMAEATIEPASGLGHLAGQYYQVQFKGFPARAFSAAPALEPALDRQHLRLHVRRYETGAVSGVLGKAIREGHGVRLTGPHGSATFESGLAGRIVLFSGGTGFAPIWAIAKAALEEDPDRSMLIVVGVASPGHLYMTSAPRWLARHPNASLVVLTEQPGAEAHGIRVGRPTDYLGLICEGDIVYAAGPPAMTAKVEEAARANGVVFRADPFEPSNTADRAGLRGLFKRTRIHSAVTRQPGTIVEARPWRRLKALAPVTQARRKEPALMGRLGSIPPD